ncbi:MAG: neutral/alkaline non-lysosomal ceramidase N-terminal domain-containing protein, partial [Candidatus Rokuibacteriota bacterium]
MTGGTFRCPITPPTGVGLMGYGARVGVATGVHDPLFARALCLSPSDTSDAPLILVSADLCLMSPAQAAGIADRISAATGVPRDGILVGCTHTHSGPETGLAALLARRPLPAHVHPVLDGLVQAGVGAFRSQVPVRLRWVTADAQIGRNRRIAGGPLDTEVLVLDVRASDRRPLAVLFNYGCHGTVLGHDNLEISADWPGTACAAIEAATGATAIFSLGAHADIDPRTRGLMDIAIAGQSRGFGFDAVHALGSEVAEAVLTALDARGEFDSQPALRAKRSAVRVPIHLGELTPSAADDEMARRKRALAAAFDVSEDDLPRTAGLFEFAGQRVQGLPVRDVRERLAAMRLYVRDRTAATWTGGERMPEISVQTLRIGDAALLALPLELTTEVGLDWKSRARRHLPHGGVASIANGWLRYLPHPR